MVRPRKSSAASADSEATVREPQVRYRAIRSPRWALIRNELVMERYTDQIQELGSMYDYLAKIILLGPSGSGK